MKRILPTQAVVLLQQTGRSPSPTLSLTYNSADPIGALYFIAKRKINNGEDDIWDDVRRYYSLPLDYIKFYAWGWRGIRAVPKTILQRRGWFDGRNGRTACEEELNAEASE
jgi:hypothetical protein